MAIEDFLAIGKDVNSTDAELRTPLHYACAYAHGDIARMLMEEGAELENKDSKGNTPLHYSAGYGRPGLVRLMLDAGSDKTALNANGKTAYDLVIAAPTNPVNESKELVADLKP
ncbi:hypothetical protein FOA52_001694 [Chlamydomonas sp. UWO 241]|nr:hypothetical protein FOA52_001694 [Chlamydomonas sp. UWO 241]